MNGKEKKISLPELTTQLTQLQKISEYVIQYDVDLVENGENEKNKAEPIDMKYLRSLYNAEIYPEVTILWKTMQLANYPVATLLLDNGLGSVDH